MIPSRLLIITCIFAAVAQPSSADDAFGGAMRLQAAALAAKGKEKGVVAGEDGWLFLPAELRHMSAGKFWGEAAEKASTATPERADPLPAIVDFHEQLQARGIELIFVPVPPKAAVYPDKVLPGAGSESRIDAADQEFLALLREKGVQVVETYEVLAGLRAAGTQACCKTDTHFSPKGAEALAGAVAKMLEEKDWARESGEIPAKEGEITFTGDLAKAAGAGAETLPARIVGQPEPIAPDAKSPVLVLGDSHALVFQAGGDMHARGAGFADQLAKELGMPVDLIAVRGSGATPVRIDLYRKASADPAWLAGKKAVVWILTAREFTQTDGWRKLPVSKAK